MIRIGTRDSKLALWQAQQVAQQLLENGFPSTLVPTKSDGDIDMVTPLYAMGVQGVFTRNLDAALLSGKIDIAVHSMKDVPVQLANGIVQAAVLPRGDVHDILVENQTSSATTKQIIATSSIRRRAQWLYRHPGTRFEVLRGNMQTRINKLATSNWHGAIFAKAGLERIDLLPAQYTLLDWMLPAPAQGAVMIVCRAGDEKMLNTLSLINHSETAICVHAERSFLQALMGGCSMPISALATVESEQLFFKGNITTPDGQSSMDIDMQFAVNEWDSAGKAAASAIIEKGADQLLDKLRHA